MTPGEAEPSPIGALDRGGSRVRGLIPPETWFPRLLGVTVLMITAVNAIRPMASYRALALGAGPFEIGLLASAFAALSLLVAVPAGRWIDRFGEMPLLVIGTTILGCSALAMVLINSVPLLVASQATLGLGHILNLVAAQTMVANRSRRAVRDQRFGIFSVAASVGQLAGPMAAGLIVGRSVADTGVPAGLATGGVFMAAGLAALAAAALGVTLRTGRAESAVNGRASEPVGHLAAAGQVLRRPTMVPAMLVSVAVILSVDLLIAYLPVYGEARGLSVELVSLLLMLRAASSMASRLVMGLLIAWIGRSALLLGSTVTASLAVAALPFTSETTVLVLLSLLMGVGLGFGQPMTIAWVASRSPRHLRGTALAVRLTGNRLGQLSVPGFVGLAAGALGIGAVFWAMSVFLAAAAVLVVRTPFDDPEEGRASGTG
jgi:MFS family permease